MAKWEHWFWVTSLWIFLLLVESHYCQQNNSPQHQRSLVDSIDTLTAPTLRPEAKEAAKREAKLTIITPSSVVAVSTAQPHPTATIQNRPLSDLSLTSKGHDLKKDNNVTVSHSVSVVSVKYSFDESGNSSEAVASKSENAGLKPNSHSTEQTVSIISRTSSEAVGARAPKSIVNVTSRQPQKLGPQNAQKLFIQLSEPSTITTTTVTTVMPSTTTTSEAVFSTLAPKAFDFEATTSIAVTPITRRSFNDRMKYEHLSADETTTLEPQEIEAENNAGGNLASSSETFYIPTTKLTTSEVPSPEASIVFQEEHGIPRLIDSHSQQQQPPNEQPQGIRSETARALNELGFSYEYIDDSDLLGDDNNNDEVIPAFHEESYNQQPSENEQFRAIPSKSELASEAISNEVDSELKVTSRQGKKAPLPHEHEPHTIVGITVGAFLLIFIGTVGLGAFIYHERYANKPHTLDDRYANSESGGCSTSVDDSIGRISYVECSGLDNPRDTYCEEMYNLDNDSFLNSLETVAMPTMLWSVSPNSDSDV